MPDPTLTVEPIDVVDPEGKLVGGTTGAVHAFLGTVEQQGPDYQVLILMTRDSGGSNLAIAKLGPDTGD